MKTTCDQCKQQFTATGARGRTPRYCSPACKQRAYRARKGSKPHALTSRDTWCRADGKRPIQPDGQPASSTNPATWASFAAVRTGAGDGVGIMLGDGLGVYDLDDCITDGEADHWVGDFLDRIGEPIVYTEISMSGRGMHVFVEADESPGSRYTFQGHAVEFYSRHRFIRTTFNTFRR